MSTAMRGERVIILGALSAIGEATAREYATAGAKLILVARDGDRLSQVAADLTSRGAAQVETEALDLAAVSDPHASLAAMAARFDGPVDAVQLFYGVLGDQEKAQTDNAEFDKILHVNFTSAAGWCNAAAGLLEKQDHGVLVAICSVAGDRGRQSNYVYGAAKGGLTLLVQGIAHRLAKGKARAVAVKLGFVDTPMTAHLEKGGPLWAKPDQIGKSLVGVARKPGRPVIYMPFFWALIMTIIKSVPSAIFHKTKL
ncbi:MAG: SDR family NAD(P)-dependent oxidoreductase [Rhodospirillaceae bacterium]